MTSDQLKNVLAAWGRGFGRRKGARAAVSLVLMAVIFTVLIRVGGWDDLRQAFSEARPVYILAAIFAHFCVIFGGAPLLWHFIVTLLGARPPLSEAYRLWLGVLCLRAILPMKAGSFVVGPNYLRLHHGLPFSRGAGSMALYHFINFYTLWVYLAVGLWWTGRAGVWLLALLTGAIGVVPFILPWMRVPVDWIGKRHRRVGDLLGHLVGGFTDISLPMRLRLIGIGCVFQLVDFMAIGLCLRAAGIDVPLAELLWRAPGVFLIANLPVTFMGLGTREAAMVAFFAPFGGKAAALAGGLIMSFSISFVPALVSLFFLPQALRMGLFSEMTNDE